MTPPGRGVLAGIIRGFDDGSRRYQSQTGHKDMLSPSVVEIDRRGATSHIGDSASAVVLVRHSRTNANAYCALRRRVGGIMKPHGGLWSHTVQGWTLWDIVPDS